MLGGAVREANRDHQPEERCRTTRVRLSLAGRSIFFLTHADQRSNNRNLFASYLNLNSLATVMKRKEMIPVDRRRSYLTELLGATIVEASKALFLFLIAGTGSAFLLRLLSRGLSLPNEDRWFLSILVGFGTGLGMVLLYQRFSKFYPHLPRIDTDFVVSSVELTYVYESNKYIRFRKKKVLKALKPGISVYNDRYHWTGNGKVRVTTDVPGHEFRILDKRNIWQFYEIDLGRAINKGETVETEILWNIDDSGDTSIPMVGYTVEEPTERIVFNLRFPPELGITELHHGVHLGIGSTRPFRSGTVRVNRDGSATWEVSRPELLHHYEVRWRFPHREHNHAAEDES